jgi:hypothetical protein
MAQSGANAILGIVGGMMAVAQVRAAQDAWALLPDLRRYCLERGLGGRYRASIASLIQNGVMPTDARLAPLANDCMRFEPAALKANYRCSVKDETGARI